MRRDAVDAVGRAAGLLGGGHGSVDLPTLAPPASAAWAARLSPQEVQDINRRANHLFDVGDVPGYAALLGRLADDGLLRRDLVSEHIAAAQRRSEQLRASFAERAATLAAMHREASQASGNASAASVRQGGDAAERTAGLLALLTRGDVGDTGSAAAVPPAAVDVAAKAAWERGTQALKGQPDWAKRLRQGTAPLTWEQACSRWEEYVAAAGAAGAGGDFGLPPRLADVIATDEQLRLAREGGDEVAIGAAERAAADLNRRLDYLHRGYVARAGGHTFPSVSPMEADADAAEAARAWNERVSTRDPADLIQQLSKVRDKRTRL
jgi:hypothetical protein